MNKCLNCEKDTKNPKFCCRSCTAVYNNKYCENIKKVRRKLTKKCKTCNNLIISKLKFCKNCRTKQLEEYQEKTIAELLVTNIHRSSMFAKIRDNARNIYRRSKKPNKCLICNYSKATDISHIKAIAEFSKDTKLKIVNHIDNLVCLCKNHHWEFDHNLLSNKDKEKIGTPGFQPRPNL